MANLMNYFNDGANCNAQAVLCLLKHLIGDGLEVSWDAIEGRYVAEFKVSRWENGREQGYVVSLRNKSYDRQLNIAFFEHRNSDGLCCVEWEQVTLNSPTIETAVFGGKYTNKHDVSYKTPYNGAYETADWVLKRFIAFWNSVHGAKKTGNP